MMNRMRFVKLVRKLPLVVFDTRFANTMPFAAGLQLVTGSLRKGKDTPVEKVKRTQSDNNPPACCEPLRTSSPGDDKTGSDDTLEDGLQGMKKEHWDEVIRETLRGNAHL